MRFPCRDQVKTWAEIAQALFTVAAIIAAGYWFRRQQQSLPRLQIEHRVSCRPLVNDGAKNLVAIDAILENIGSVAVYFPCGHLSVLDVNPGKARLIWSQKVEDPTQGCLPPMFIEPGEPDQVHREISIDKTVKTIRIHSFFANPTQKNGNGWEFISLFDLDCALPKQSSEVKDMDTRSPKSRSTR